MALYSDIQGIDRALAEHRAALNKCMTYRKRIRSKYDSRRGVYKDATSGQLRKLRDLEVKADHARWCLENAERAERIRKNNPHELVCIEVIITQWISLLQCYCGVVPGRIGVGT